MWNCRIEIDIRHVHTEYSTCALFKECQTIFYQKATKAIVEKFAIYTYRKYLACEWVYQTEIKLKKSDYKISCIEMSLRKSIT